MSKEKRGAARYMPGEKASNFKKTMSTLLTYVKPYRVKVAAVILFAVASTVFSIVSPVYLGKATDVIVDGVKNGMNIDYVSLQHIFILLLILYGASFMFSFLQSFIISEVAQKITYKLRRQISEKMDRLPAGYFDGKSRGDIQSRITNDVDTINQTLTQSMTQLITSFVTIVGILLMMIYICLQMTAAALIVIPLSFLAIKLVVKLSQKEFRKNQKYLGELNGHVEEMFNGQLVVKAFNQENQSITKFREMNESLYDSAWKSQFLSGIMMPIIICISNVAYVFVCVIGGFLALRGNISIGRIQTFLQYVKSFNQPISMISNIANVLQSTAACAERVFEFLDEEDEVDCIETSGASDAELGAPGEETGDCQDFSQKVGNIEFNHLCFGYKPENILIRDFNFQVKPGQRIAIVGPTGAGKTTIIKLLLRFYELNGGEIKVGGRNIKEYHRQELRKLFGMVLQDTWLFNGTIMENIRYGRADATDQQVVEAARAAHIHHFIKTQPGGYQMVIDEGAGNISQGQKQLLTIARAFLADAPILILDEATSSVDTRTEVQIQKAMSDLMKGRTSFVIAHRLSTIRDADVILVINHGDIIETGNHDELMAAGGFYANLYNSQFEN